MKAVNIVLSVLILLLAIAAAVFSYFLFEKRSQFVTGWEKMATIIQKSATELDKGSGTKEAAKLTVEALSHRNYEKLDSLKDALPQQSRKIIIQRDALAGKLQEIGGYIDVKVEKSKLTDVGVYATAVRPVVTGVSTVVTNRNNTYRNLISTAKNSLNVTIDQKLLLSGSSSAFTTFGVELRKIRDRSVAYEQHIGALARLSGVNIAKLNDSNRNAEVRKIDAAIRKLKSNIQDLARQLDAAKSINKAQLATIDRYKKSVERLEINVKNLNLQIGNFQRALGLPAVRKGETPWLPGSAEARAAVRGKVVAVNEKYGYITVNVGKYSVVEQEYGNEVLEVNPKLEQGMTVVITRKTAQGSDFIARVQLAQVGETASVANITPDAKKIKVGDIVTVPVEESRAAAPAAAPKAAAKR